MQLTRSTLLVVLLLWWGEPKMSAAPSAACRAVQNELVKRVSRLDTSTSGRPTSWNLEPRPDVVASGRISSSGLEGRDQPHAARQNLKADVRLQQVVARTSCRQLEKVPG